MRWMNTLALIGLMACAGQTEETPEPAPEPAPVEAPAAPKAPPPKPVAAELPADANPALLNPELATKEAPGDYRVKVTTSKGEFVLLVHKAWAPKGADRFYNLVDIGYYNDVRFFRAIEDFMVQWGINGYPQVSEAWREAKIMDDEVKESNLRGRITFATAGKNTRTTQLFINYKDNTNLDGMGFSPFGEVVEGMDVVDSLFKGYGEGQPRGRGPHQAKTQKGGNAYLDAEFPKLDRIIKMEFVD